MKELFQLNRWQRPVVNDYLFIMESTMRSLDLALQPVKKNAIGTRLIWGVRRDRLRREEGGEQN